MHAFDNEQGINKLHPNFEYILRLSLVFLLLTLNK